MGSMTPASVATTVSKGDAARAPQRWRPDVVTDAALALTRGLTWTPLGNRRPALDRVDLRIEPGERVLLVGPSGSGKSTLLRALAGVLQAGGDGELTGEVLIEGRPVQQADTAVGLLLQDPRDARVAETVGRDVAFACENSAMPRELIPGAVEAALQAVGFPYGPQHRTDELSGGQAQRLALAGVIAAWPRLLLLDEPTSMLDPIAAAHVRSAVLSVVDERSGLVVVEHRLHGWVEHLPRLVVLDGAGRIVADGNHAGAAPAWGSTGGARDLGAGSPRSATARCPVRAADADGVAVGR